MSSAIVPTEEAINMVVEMIRLRLSEARSNGQKVRMHAKETTRSQRFASADPIPSFAELFAGADKDGGFELSISIEPRPPGAKRIVVHAKAEELPGLPGHE